MKRRMRLISLAMVLIMFVTLFAGCKTNDNPDTSSTTTGLSNTSTTTEATTTTVPLRTFGGRALTFWCWLDVHCPQVNDDGSFRSALDEEWQGKLDEMAAKFDIKFEYSQADNTSERMVEAGMAGEKLADIIWMRQPDYWAGAKAGYILPVNGKRLMNAGLDCFDSTRWFVPTVESTSLFGKAWGVSVASKYIAVITGYFVTFNKALVAEAGYDDLYSMVRNKTWTYDVYLDIAKKCTKDTNGDNMPDIWGTGCSAFGNEMLTNGIDFIARDENGKYFLQVDSPAGIEVLQFLHERDDTSGTRLREGTGATRQAFADGTVALNYANMGHIGKGNPIYGANHDYGIVPMPLGPNGKEYVSTHNDCDVFVFMNQSNEELDTVVYLANEWALIVNDQENYLDILDDGRCRTEQDKEMMREYIIPNFRLSMLKVNDDINKTVGYLDDVVSSYGYTPAAAIETYAEAARVAIDDFFNSFTPPADW